MSASTKTRLAATFFRAASVSGPLQRKLIGTATAPHAVIAKKAYVSTTPLCLWALGTRGHPMMCLNCAIWKGPHIPRTVRWWLQEKLALRKASVPLATRPMRSPSLMPCASLRALLSAATSKDTTCVLFACSQHTVRIFPGKQAALCAK